MICQVKVGVRVASQESGKNEKIDELNVLHHLRDTINLCQIELMKNEIQEEVSYYYAVVRVYSKVMVTCGAIYTLLDNGYPDEAIGLCRKLYESLVIIDLLLKGNDKHNTKLLEQFLDAPIIQALKVDYQAVNYALKIDPSDSYAQSVQKEIIQKSRDYLDKYNKKEMREFKDYWWSDYNSFSTMAQHSDFPKYYAYTYVSDRVHMNAIGAFDYLATYDQKGILIGSTEGGKKQPIWYMSMYLYCIAGIINMRFPEICPDIIISALKRIKDEAEMLLKD